MIVDYPEYLLVLAVTLIAAATVPITHVAYLRLTKNMNRTIDSMFGSFLVCALVWLALFFILKDSRSNFLAEYISGFSMLGFLWFGYMEVVFQLYRGFSHTIVTDVARTGPVTLQQELDGFAEGLGMHGMLMRRLHTMEKKKLVIIEGQQMTLTPSGKRMAIISRHFKSAFKMGAGG